MAKLLCQSTVKKLLKAGINYKEYKRLVCYLNSQTDAPIWDIALIWTPEIREKFWRAMVELQKELVPQYIDINSLYSKLWGLFREVVLNKSTYQDLANLERKMSDFANEVKKPLVAFEVLYEIRHFSIGKRQIKLGDVEIFELTEDYLKSLEAGELLIEDKWVGRTVAKVEVDASYPGGANVLGKTEVNNALNVLRLAVRRELISKGSEDMFMWELSESIVIPKVKPENEIPSLFSVFDSGKDRPLVIDLGDTIEKCLEDESTWKCILDSKLPEDIGGRVTRAIEWISHGITGEDLDYKLVNLCVALEILLLPKERRETSKGALIALRQVLVGQNTYFEPRGIFAQYKRRNTIIHGDYLNVTGYSDYWHFLACCLSVLENIVRLSQKYPEADNLRALLDKVENKETLEEFIKHYKLGFHKCREAKEMAERLLEQCQ